MASPGSSALPAAVAASLDIIVRTMVATLDSSDVTALKTLWLTSRSVPREFDGKLLARSRAELSRDLAPEEKRYVRSRFITLIQVA